MSNKNLLILAAICFVLGSLTRIVNNLPPANPYALSAQEEARLGLPSPEFSFTTLDGARHALSDFKGRAVILNFWATWCPPCVVEFPQMLNLAREVGDDVVLIFISSDIDEPPIRRFLDRLAKTHEAELKRKNVLIAHDPGKTITQTLFQTHRLPETYLLTPGHLIDDKVIGASVVWDDAAMVEKIRALAAKPR